MALTPLESVYKKSGSAYSQKLNAVANVFSNIQASQERKRQAAQELAQQKELTEYEYNLRTQSNAISNSQKQAQESQQAIIDRFNESFDDATKKRMELYKELSNREWDALAKYNMNSDYEFKVEQGKDATGQPVAKTNIYKRVGEGSYQSMSYGDYRQEIQNARSFVEDFLVPLEENEVYAPENPREDTQYITPEYKEEFLRRVKTDPEYRHNVMQQAQLEKLDYEIKTTEKESRRENISEGVPSLIGQLKYEFKDNTKKDYTWYENEWGVFDEATGAFSIDYQSSVASVKKQIETAISKGFFEDSSLNIGSIPQEVRNKMANGELTEEELETLPTPIREDVGTLNDVSGDKTRSALKDLVNKYNIWDRMYATYTNDTDQALPPDEVYFDVWGAPKDLQGNYEQVFKPIVENPNWINKQEANTRKLQDFVSSINREVEAFSSFSD